MHIVRHEEQTAVKGYYSKIINRQIVNADMGATQCTVWEQIIPPGGYIVPHYHPFEETLTFLTGQVEVKVGDKVYQIEAVTTLFVPSQVVHSVQNRGDEPVRLLAVLMSAQPQVIYPAGRPEPVVWDGG